MIVLLMVVVVEGAIGCGCDSGAQAQVYTSRPSEGL